MTSPELPSFDLVVATVDRADSLARLLDSLERQTHRSFRLLVVVLVDDDRIAPVLESHAALDLVRLRSPRGLSRARNAAL
ncbi:MAG: glycosyltransferase, partial [Gaiellaceae bacterium]